MITQQLRQDFRRFLYSGLFIMTGRQAEAALRSAKTLAQWRKLEAQGRVRLVKEEEQESYFDNYDDTSLTERQREQMEEVVERTGNWWVAAEYIPKRRPCCKNCGSSDCCRYPEFETADSVGMCAGYEDPLDPFENCYIVPLMDSAIEKAIEH